MNVIYAIHARGGEDPASSLKYDQPLAGIVNTAITELGLQHHENGYEKAKEAAFANGSVVEMKDCFMDMDTGDIIYY